MIKRVRTDTYSGPDRRSIHICDNLYRYSKLVNWLLSSHIHFITFVSICVSGWVAIIIQIVLKVLNGVSV